MGSHHQATSAVPTSQFTCPGRGSSRSTQRPPWTHTCGRAPLKRAEKTPNLDATPNCRHTRRRCALTSMRWLDATMRGHWARHPSWSSYLSHPRPRCRRPCTLMHRSWTTRWPVASPCAPPSRYWRWRARAPPRGLGRRLTNRRTKSSHSAASYTSASASSPATWKTSANTSPKPWTFTTRPYRLWKAAS